MNKTEIDNAFLAIYNPIASNYFLHASEPQTEFDKQMMIYFKLICEQYQLPQLVNYCSQRALKAFLDNEISNSYTYFLTEIDSPNII